jgi:hypothetical protein
LTKSGAEGLSLLSVREVHIMEPMLVTLIEQVKGGLLRLVSHAAAAEDRVVDIFRLMYVGRSAR